MAINTNEITKQVIDFQKSAFTNWYDAVSLMQDQATAATENLINQSSMVPADSNKALDKWVDAFKANRKNLKKQIDDNFKQAEKLLII